MACSWSRTTHQANMETPPPRRAGWDEHRRPRASWGTVQAGLRHRRRHIGKPLGQRRGRQFRVRRQWALCHRLARRYRRTRRRSRRQPLRPTSGPGKKVELQRCEPRCRSSVEGRTTGTDPRRSVRRRRGGIRLRHRRSLSRWKRRRISAWHRSSILGADLLSTGLDPRKFPNGLRARSCSRGADLVATDRAGDRSGK